MFSLPLWCIPFLVPFLLSINFSSKVRLLHILSQIFVIADNLEFHFSINLQQYLYCISQLTRTSKQWKPVLWKPQLPKPAEKNEKETCGCGSAPYCCVTECQRFWRRKHRWGFVNLTTLLHCFWNFHFNALFPAYSTFYFTTPKSPWTLFLNQLSKETTYCST